MSSASNTFALLAVARVSDVIEFGIVSLLWIVIMTAVSLLRGLVGTPLLLASAQSAQVLRRELEHSFAIAAVLGCLTGICIAIVGIAFDGVYLAIPLAIAAPIVLLQDVHRYGAVAGGRINLALVSDGVWAAASVGALLITFLPSSVSSPNMVLAIWAFFGGVSLVTISIGQTMSLRFSGGIAWLRSTAKDRTRYGLEAAVGSASALFVAMMGVVLIGVTSAAALQGAGTLLGPLSVIITALPLAVIPEALRANHTNRQTWILLRRLGVAMSILAILIGLAGYILPAQIGDIILGQSWSIVAPLLPFTGLEYAALAWVCICLTMLRSQGKSSDLFKGPSFTKRGISDAEHKCRRNLAKCHIDGRWPGSGGCSDRNSNGAHRSRFGRSRCPEMSWHLTASPERCKAFLDKDMRDMKVAKAWRRRAYMDRNRTEGRSKLTASTGQMGLAAAILLVACLGWAADAPAIVGVLGCIAMVTVCSVYWYRRSQKDAFHPLVFPTLYLAFALLGPWLYVWVSGLDIGSGISPKIVDSPVIWLMILTVLGWLLGTSMFLSTEPRRARDPRPDNRIRHDNDSLILIGRSILGLLVFGKLAQIWMSAGKAYGADQTYYGGYAILTVRGLGPIRGCRTFGGRRKSGQRSTTASVL